MPEDALKTPAEAAARVSCVAGTGVVAVAGKMLFRQLAYTPAQVISVGAGRVAGRASRYGGVYFLIWRRQIVYVGRAGCLWSRLADHQREGRPHEGVAVIAGLPPRVSAALESCYVSAWRPPWNAAVTGGWDKDADRLAGRLRGMDLAPVMPWYTPAGGRALEFLKRWQIHALGVAQADARCAAAPV